jgi:hypothetical protein
MKGTEITSEENELITEEEAAIIIEVFFVLTCLELNKY